MTREDYLRGWEDCLDILYYKLLKAGIRDERVFKVLKELQRTVKEDKISRLMNELGLI